MNIDALINDFSVSLEKIFPDFGGIYLFGSRANKTAHEGSDIDLVLMFQDINKEKNTKVYDIISDLMYKYDIFIDAKIMNEQMLKFNPFFYQEIKEKGVFYGAR